jgi:nitrite reductase/ring-hydroxylating ferredoxin subunit
MRTSIDGQISETLRTMAAEEELPPAEHVVRRVEQRLSRRRMRRRALVGAATIVVLGAIALGMNRPGHEQLDVAGEDDGTVLVEAVEGTAPVEIDDTVVWIVRRGTEVTVFADNDRHLDGPLMWCPAERYFAGPHHGALFDEDGRHLAGPAVGGLHRYDARVVDDRVAISLHRLEPGSPKRDDVPERHRDTIGGPWDSGPGSFCAEAVHSPRYEAPPPAPPGH